MEVTTVASSASSVSYSLLQRELEKEKARSAMLDEMVPPLEKMRHDLKAVTLSAQSAMITAGVPTAKKNDKDIPFYFSANSWESRAEVPWSHEENRAMTIEEGVLWLAMRRDDAKAEAESLREELSRCMKEKERDGATCSPAAPNALDQQQQGDA